MLVDTDAMWTLTLKLPLFLLTGVESNKVTISGYLLLNTVRDTSIMYGSALLSAALGVS